jgi:hypothetical protein
MYQMVSGTLDAVSFQQPLIIAGLVLAGAGAILWFGAFTLAEVERERTRLFATSLVLLSPICLAWSLLIEVGTVALWVLLGFFGVLLVGVVLANYFLPRLLPRFLRFISRHFKRHKDQPQGGDSQRGKADTDAIPDRVSEGSEQHSLSVRTSTLTASEKSLANASVLIAVGLTLLVQGMRALRTSKE